MTKETAIKKLEKHLKTNQFDVAAKIKLKILSTTSKLDHLYSDKLL